MLETDTYPSEDKWFYEDTKYDNISAPLTVDTVIYKFIKFDYFLLMLRNKKIRLDKIISWPDPFENLLLRCDCYTPEGRHVNLDDQKNSLYGFCFSEIDESDAFWRIYSPQQGGVRLKTTVGKFFDALYGNGHTKSERISLFFRKVDYVTEDEFSKIIENPEKVKSEIFNQKPNKIAFMKREAFSHENEIRLLYSIAGNHPDFGKEIIEFDVDVNEIFDELTVDPRVGDFEFEKVKLLAKSFGFEGDINKSDLYGEQNYKITISLNV